MKGLDPYDAKVNAAELAETAKQLFDAAPRRFVTQEIGAWNELLVRIGAYEAAAKG